MSETKEQQEQRLLEAGWTQWDESLADGRTVKLPFWKDQGGPSYRNEQGQFEYASGQRRYTLQEALRIVRLREETAIYRAKLKAEQDRKSGLTAASLGSAASGLSPAEVASRAVAEAVAAESQTE